MRRASRRSWRTVRPPSRTPSCGRSSGRGSCGIGWEADMPTWPRAADAKPRACSIPRFPMALSNWGLAGKGQFRGVTNMGREWTEIYPALQMKLAAVGALLAAIDRGLREGTIWDIDCLFYTKRG